MGRGVGRTTSSPDAGRRPATGGAASTTLIDVLTGRAVPLDVLAVSPYAAYAMARGDTRDGAQLVVLSRPDALRLPCSIVVGSTSLASIEPSSSGTIGRGRVEIAGLDMFVSRWWQPRRALATQRTIRRVPAEMRTSALPGCHETLRAGAMRLAAAVSDRDPTAINEVVDALLGSGGGLTPSGDDVLAGFLVAAQAFHVRGPEVATVATTVRGRAAGRTTALSAALLLHAARGYGIDALVDLVDVIARGDPDGVGASLGELLKVGHESGPALALGVRTALAASQTLIAAA